MKITLLIVLIIIAATYIMMKDFDFDFEEAVVGLLLFSMVGSGAGLIIFGIYRIATSG